MVDDEPDLRTLYELTLLREGYRVETAGSVQEGAAQLQERSFDVVITDMRLPDGIGMELLLQLRDQSRSERCIVMTAYGSAENAVEALRAGAFDYLTKPVDLRQFRQVVASAVQGIGAVPKPGTLPAGGSAPTQDARAATPPGALDALVGDSQAMQRVKQRIAKVAKGMAPVLIHGESGTGKELVARALHACSQRADGPMIAVNCGAIPENLLEAEFFGARKGSYTGATQDRPGYFQAAQGGTLFLDEIGDLPLAMQAKLLRAIQERKIRPLGSTQEEAVDVRILSATHRDLSAQVQRGHFRQDLFYRLNVIEIELPALRERREDLGQLCQALLQKLARESGLPTPELDDIGLDQIARLPLPGNVRELENVLHRAIALGDGGPLRLPESGPPADGGSAPADPASGSGTSATGVPAPLTPHAGSPATLPEDLQGWLDEQERSILVRALQDNGFNRTATAARLGISLRQIRYRIDRLGIDLPAEGCKHQSDNA
ncbi:MULTISPECIES: sigma-54-dependent transcriptional regulator [Comamonas]|uniref:sigma-54-dependent transcriptional regulator n=1 Tax=Comamonas TaxID=283 RepID=UPI0025C650D0|nr:MULTISPECIES: sigma-54 dependent transcriptional regulator [Comamonas]MDR3065712.1 sigma-54 dependent transcriptional regulator [Comamonas sp.]MEB5963561.1 sigma-54 dependent transcriptional regulator [Comamonas testosteroni]